MKHDHLLEAFMNKKDEFYTQYSTIEAELPHHKSFFKGKTVYCPCDDPDKSNFVKFFKDNFTEYGLKKLIATHHSERAYKYEYDGVYERKTEMAGTGSFDSDECIVILKMCDVVVTNPPFSLFRKFFELLMENNKDFLIIGNLLSAGYKQVFPHIKSQKVQLGYSLHKGGTLFEIPESYGQHEHAVKKNGKFYAPVSARWFTTLPVSNHIPMLELTEEYTPEKYPRYDNFDAINVDKTRAIPKDYYDIMGVPLTFVDFWNRDQFEVVGLACRWSDMHTKFYERSSYDLNAGGVINGKVKFQRILIRRRTHS